MKPLMPWVDEVQWYEGMLLGPQQLQQTQLRARTLMNHSLCSTSPYFWGVETLEIDPVLLITGTFRVLSMRACLQDGTYICFEGANDFVLEADFSSLKESMVSSGAQKVHLALPLENSNSSNLTGDFPRYKSVPGTNVCDLNTGESFIYVPRLIPNLQLIIGDKLHPRYVGFPIAEVKLEDDGFQLTNFIPPQTLITKLLPLGVILHTIILALRNKCAFLAETLQSNSSGTLDPAVRTHYERLMGILVPHIPTLENLYGVETTHPYALYQELLWLAGSMAAIKNGLLAPTFTPYNHVDLYASFDQLVTFIMSMINLIEENYITQPFTLDGNTFKLDIQSSWESDLYIIGIKGTSTAGPDLLVPWISQGIIASESQIKSVRDRRILGAERSIIEVNQALSISPPENGILVSVKNDPEFIKPGEKLCLLNLQDNPLAMPSQLFLFVRKKTADGAASS